MDKKKKNIKQFFLAFLLVSIGMFICIITLSYYVDPFFQFRVKDHQYLLNPRFVNPGLAKNGNYNTVVIGSSMVQNFDFSILRKDPSVKPVKLASGAMNIPEMKLMYNLSNKDKTKTYIINLDIPQFALEEPENKYLPYLYQEGLIDKLQYIFSYEGTVRYLPVDIVLSNYINIEKNISTDILFRTSIDDIGNFIKESNYSKEYVKQLYLNNSVVSMPLMYNIESRMRNNLDDLLQTLEIEKNSTKEYIFILPPYSALYWYHTKRYKYNNEFISFIYYLTSKLEKYKNVKIVSYYDIEEIIDLDNYTDMTHFNPDISKLVLSNLNTDKYILNEANVKSRIAKLDSLTNVFEIENKDWLK